MEVPSMVWTYRDLIFSCSRDPMTIFADSRHPIFNSKDPNRVPKTPLKNPNTNIFFARATCFCNEMWNQMPCFLVMITIVAARFLHLYACLTYTSAHASILHHCLPTIHLCYADVFTHSIACPSLSVLCWCLFNCVVFLFVFVFFLSVLKFSLVCFVFVTYGISCYYAIVYILPACYFFHGGVLVTYCTVARSTYYVYFSGSLKLKHLLNELKPEVAGVTFSDSDSASVPKFLNPGLAPVILKIRESDSLFRLLLLSIKPTIYTCF